MNWMWVECAELWRAPLLPCHGSDSRDLGAGAGVRGRVFVDVQRSGGADIQSNSSQLSVR